MTDAQIAFELDYWRQAKRAEHDARQKKILELWGFAYARSVLEIGPGPWGGCLPFIEARFKGALEPLFYEYRWNGLFDWPDDVYKWQPSFRCDAVVTMNALDHGDGDFSAIAGIAEALKPGGMFYLHVHLRRPDQLNVGHDHALTLEALESATAEAGLKPVKVDVYETDPVEGCAYKTVIGVWRK